MLSILVPEALSYGVRLTDEQLGQFARYLALLQAWSSKANLVGDDDEEVVQRRHFAESIAFGAALREREVLRPDTSVLDVGAGAGFTGISMKIAWPSIRLALLEATAKKTAFLSALVLELGWGAEAAVHTGRAETLGHDPALRERFDLVVARAVAPLPALLELTLPFALIGGRMATPKGARAEEEVKSASNATRVLGARLFVVPLRVPGPEQRLVVALKQRATPDEYPRRDGVPAKTPL